MDLEGIKLNGISQTEKDKYYLYVGSKKYNSEHNKRKQAHRYRKQTSG